MRNYFIITLGTREVQFRKDWLEAAGWELITEHRNGKECVVMIKKEPWEIAVMHDPRVFPNFLTIPQQKVRSVGKLIADNYTSFASLIDIPLIAPTITLLEAENKAITDVLTIYTDQEEDVLQGNTKVRFMDSDTLYFNGIVVQKLKETNLLANATFDEYCITEKVSDIDYQYTHFFQLFKKGEKNAIFDKLDTIKNIYLLPQGGIDQINHAITLQLLQAFREKVLLYQQPEVGKPKNLAFTNLFLADLDKQKALKHLEDFDFGLAIEFLKSDSLKIAKHLAMYAHKRLNMQHNELNDHVTFLQGKSTLNIITLVNDKTDYWQKMQDLYLSAKIAYKQKKYADCISRIYTLGENLFRKQLEDKYDVNFDIRGNKDEKKHEFAKIVRKIGFDAMQYLAKSPLPHDSTQKASTDAPSRWAYYILFCYAAQQGKLLAKPQYESIFCILEKLSQSRNELLHNMKPVTQADLQNARIETLMQQLEEVLEIEGYGIYKKIAIEMAKFL